MDSDDKFKINDRIPEVDDQLTSEAHANDPVKAVEQAPPPPIDKNLAFPTKDFESANSAVVMSGRVGKTKKKLWFLLFLLILIVAVALVGVFIVRT